MEIRMLKTTITGMIMVEGALTMEVVIWVVAISKWKRKERVVWKWICDRGQEVRRFIPSILLEFGILPFRCVPCGAAADAFFIHDWICGLYLNVIHLA